MSSTKTADKYRPVFLRYLQAALRQSLSQAQEHQYDISENVRVQACHVLALALDIEALWEQTSRLLVTLSPKMELTGQWDIWIPFLEKGIAVSRQIGDDSVLARLCLDLGLFYRRLYMNTDANHLFAEAQKLYEELDSPTGTALCLNQIALSAMVQRDYSKANELAHKALDLMDSEHPERANSHFILGTIQRQSGELESARRSFELAIDLRSKQGNHTKVAASLIGLARVDRRLGHAEAEREHLIKANDLLSETGNIVSQADVQNSLGISYSLSGDSFKAIDFYRHAASTYQEVGNVGNLASVYTNMGIDYTNLEEWDLATEALEASLKINQQIDNILSEVNALIELARLYQLKGDKQIAQSYLNSASRQLRQTDEPYRTAELAQEIATLAESITAGFIPISG